DTPPAALPSQVTLAAVEHTDVAFAGIERVGTIRRRRISRRVRCAPRIGHLAHTSIIGCIGCTTIAVPETGFVGVKKILRVACDGIFGSKPRLLDLRGITSPWCILA